MSKAQRKSEPYVKGRIAPSQIKAIHTAIGRLGMDDETYRHMLHSRYGATSCKDLSWQQAEALLAHLNDTPHRPRRSGSTLKYADMDGRPGFATGAQCRLIDAMWNQVTRATDEESAEQALNNFCNRILGVAGLRMVKSWQVEKIVKALEGMGAVIKRTDPQGSKGGAA